MRARHQNSITIRHKMAMLTKRSNNKPLCQITNSMTLMLKILACLCKMIMISGTIITSILSSQRRTRTTSRREHAIERVYTPTTSINSRNLAPRLKTERLLTSARHTTTTNQKARVNKWWHKIVETTRSRKTLVMKRQWLICMDFRFLLTAIKNT